MMEAAVGWRDDDAMASASMVSLADDSGGNGSCCHQLAVAVDATTTIPSLALTVAAKTPLLLPPSTVPSIDDDCRCRTVEGGQ